MTTTRIAGSMAAALGLLALTLAGCPTTEESRLYLLSPLPQSAKPAQTPLGDTTIRLRVDVAEYLNRSEIVTRVSENRYRLAEYDLWAEPLKDNFSRVLADNLSLLLGTEKVIVTDWSGRRGGGLLVDVSVARLDAVVGKDVTLDIRWQVLADGGKPPPRMGKSHVSEAVNQPTFDALVAAASRALGTVSREIAAAVRTAAAKP